MGFKIGFRKLSCCSTLFYKIISITAGLRHLRFSMVEQFQQRLARLQFEQEKVSDLSSYLLPTHKKKSYLPYRFTTFHMFIEEIILPKTFVAQWASISLQNICHTVGIYKLVKRLASFVH